MCLNKFVQGKGLWKFNTDLLKDLEYVHLINKIINEEIIKYAVPIYNFDNFSKFQDEEITLTISDDLFLEMLILTISGETIKYSSLKKKKEKNNEIKLISEIEELEKKNNITDANILDAKRQELILLRESKMKGHYIRSRVQWLHEGERPTKYFCSLEHQNFITKTIKKVKTKDGTIITDQKVILAEVKSFYSQLFQNQDNKINEVDLKDLLKGIESRKLTGLQAKALEGELKLEELTKTLKNMQNNKTPGIDGFPAEFFKVFWTKLGKWVLRALITVSEMADFL